MAKYFLCFEMPMQKLNLKTLLYLSPIFVAARIFHMKFTAFFLFIFYEAYIHHFTNIILLCVHNVNDCLYICVPC